MNQGRENFVFFKCGNVSPIFCWSSKFAFVSPSKLPVAREAIHVSTGSCMCEFRSALGVSLLMEALTPISINGVVSLEHYH